MILLKLFVDYFWYLAYDCVLSLGSRWTKALAFLILKHLNSYFVSNGILHAKFEDAHSFVLIGKKFWSEQHWNFIKAPEFMSSRK